MFVSFYVIYYLIEMVIYGFFCHIYNMVIFARIFLYVLHLYIELVIYVTFFLSLICTTWSSLFVSLHVLYHCIEVITHDCSYFFMILLFYIDDVRNGRLCLYLFMYLSCVYLIPFDYGLLWLVILFSMRVIQTIKRHLNPHYLSWYEVIMIIYLYVQLLWIQRCS